jgi:hypothetical protein
MNTPRHEVSIDQLIRDIVAAAGEIVPLYIGHDNKLYRVHKDPICHYSVYFHAAYNGLWKEAEDGVTLDDIDTDVFDIFVH